MQLGIPGNRLPGGGISSGLGEALKLITLLVDEGTTIALQQMTQSFPQPPVAGRIPETPPCMIDWRAKKRELTKGSPALSRK